MRVLICGDRNWSDLQTMENFFQKLDKDTLIIEGEARGADTMARQLAEKYRFNLLPFKAEWEKYGRAAGPIRNSKMLIEGKPDLVVAFHNYIQSSKGTKNMIEKAKKYGVKVTLITSDR